MQRLFGTIKSHLPHALHKSASTGDFYIIKQILAKSPKRVNDYYDFQTPLHLACTARQYDCMLLLLKYGANVSARLDFYPRNWTPLHTAAYKGDVSATRLLLLFGADPNLIDNEGHTPLSLCRDKLMARRALENTAALHQRILSLEEQAKTNSNPEQQAMQLQDIAKCWQDAAANETEPFLKLYYLHEALWHAKQAYNSQPSSLTESLCNTLLTQIKQVQLKNYYRLDDFFDKSFLSSIRISNLNLDSEQNQFANMSLFC